MSRVMDADAVALRESSAARRAPGRRRGSQESLLSRGVAMLIMVVFTLYFLVPIWWLLVASTKTRGDLFTTNPLWFSDLALWDNIVALLNYDGGIYLRWILNSIAYAGVGALVATILAGMCGYALAKYRFRGRELLFNVVLGGVLVPATALALPLFLLFSQVQLTNTFWAVFLPSIVSGGERSRRAARSQSPGRRRRGAHVLHGVDPADAAGPDHDLPVPVRGDLEQLLPAAHHAAQRRALPGDLRPVRVELDHQPVPRTAQLRADRRAPVDRAAHHHVPPPPALLAHRPGNRRPQVRRPRPVPPVGPGKSDSSSPFKKERSCVT
jgi:hypothetical protein